MGNKEKAAVSGSEQMPRANLNGLIGDDEAAFARSKIRRTNVH